MLKTVAVKLEDIYIPAARRKELDQSKLDGVVEDMLNGEEQKPIRVREGKGRYVLVAGIHRLEASKAVGENTIDAYIVQAPKF
ncbi:MAG: chromosome partitioning protein ParB [Kordiimonadales bacterium]|nr:MAG: chromosome partitioning protein ParB [Kordiimonadales bacterium]